MISFPFWIWFRSDKNKQISIKIYFSSLNILELFFTFFFFIATFFLLFSIFFSIYSLCRCSSSKKKKTASTLLHFVSAILVFCWFLSSWVNFIDIWCGCSVDGRFGEFEWNSSLFWRCFIANQTMVKSSWKRKRFEFGKFHLTVRFDPF